MQGLPVTGVIWFFVFLVGALVLAYQRVSLRTATLAYGGALLITLIRSPEGIAGTEYAKKQRKRKAAAAKAVAAAPPERALATSGAAAPTTAVDV